MPGYILVEDMLDDMISEIDYIKLNTTLKLSNRNNLK